MAIDIKLLNNKRFSFKNESKNLIIMSEHNATEITVAFPYGYENYSKRVDFLNSENESWTEPLYCPEFKDYPPNFDRLQFTFTLPNEVTIAGELRMQFVAYMPDESLTSVPFEIVPLEIEDGIIKYKKSGAKNPELIVLSYKQSSQALFAAQSAEKSAQLAHNITQQFNQIANNAEQKADAAISAAKEANIKLEETRTVSQQALDNSEQAKNIANLQDEKVTEAFMLAQVAKKSASVAIETATTANEAAAESKSHALKAIEEMDRVAINIDDVADKAKAALSSSVSAEQKATEAKDAIQNALLQLSDVQDKTTDIENTLTEVAAKAEKIDARTTDIESKAQSALKGLNSKVEKESGKGLSSEDYTAEEKEKLSSIEAGAIKYVHPTSHSPSIIMQDANNRFTTDAEKERWNSYKQPHSSSVIIAPHDATETSKAGADIILNGDETDSERINAAIATLINGGEIRILEGTIKCTSTIILHSNITLSGQGGGTIFEKYFEDTLFVVSENENVLLRDFKVNSNACDGYSMSFSMANDCQVANIFVLNATDGIEIKTSGSVSIFNSKISTVSYCLNLSGKNYVRIEGCYCISTTRTAINVDACDKCTFTTTVIIGNANNAILLRQLNHSKITNCHIESVSGMLAGSLIQSTYNIVANNILRSSNNRIALISGNNNVCVGNSGNIASSEGSTTIVANNLT